jgi:DNA-binding LytR/AlgR family response regulator
MRAFLLDDRLDSFRTFNKKPELNYPEAEIETGYSTAIATDPLSNKADNARFLLATRLCLPTQKGFTIVKLDEIVYCEAQRSYTQIHLLNNKSMTASKPLFDYDRILTDTTFLRIHKSFLIIMLHVREYSRGEGGTVIMSNGMEIEVSRRRKELFLTKVKEFFKY